MRLIHVVPAISEEASGPTYSVVRLCESLQAAGNELALVALDWAPVTNPPEFLKVFPLGRGPARLGRSPLMYRWLMERCSSGTVDILHNHGMWQFNSLYPGWACGRRDVCFVHSPRGAFSKWAMEHGSKAKRVFWPLLQRPSLECAACFHVTSDAEYHDVRRLGFRQPVAIIPNGIDVPPEVERQGDNTRTLLFLSRIHKKKGIENLLAAWRVVQRRFPDWRLLIVGGDEGYYGGQGYLNSLKQMHATLKLERVQFVGPLFGSAKWKAIAAADLFVLPTYSENFGMAVAEALAAGVPAIVTKGAPWSGLVRNDAGWWIDVGVEPLVVAMIDAMGATQDRRARMGANGRAWMIRDFSWPEVARRMTATYAWLRDRGLPVPDWVRTD